jgi:UDP-glucose 4-epimerase
MNRFLSITSNSFAINMSGLLLTTMNENARSILVTGGAGYIGSHVVKALVARGLNVIILDNLVYGHRDLVEANFQAELVVGDIGDKYLLTKIFLTHKINAVMHFAAYAYVGESVIDPAKYYQNNVVGTISLLDVMREQEINNLVFSSTCATYGMPQQIPIDENHPQNPISPYGFTKLTIERILQDYDRAYGLKSIIFRYFNAAGADPEGQLGEDHTPETHLIPLVLQAASGELGSVSIFGTDYDTPDGTCIRDYIHVTDLAEAHVLGLEYLLENRVSEIFNLGNGNGFSVKEVIDTAKQVTGKEISIVESPKREGDPSELIGSAIRAQELLNWQPKYSKLQDIIQHAWNWHQYRHS